MQYLFMPVLMSSALLLASTAQASDKTQGGLGVSLGVDLISGAEIEFSYPINSFFGLRASLASGLNVDRTNEGDNSRELDYQMKIDGGVNRISLDYHPFGSSFAGGFFVSVGYGFSDFYIKPYAYKASGKVEIGQDTYDVENFEIFGSSQWDSAPTLSFGWGHSSNKGFGFMAEAGVIMTGSPDVFLSAEGKVFLNGSQDEESFNESMRDEKDEFDNDVNQNGVLPILRVGVSYRF